MRNRVCDACGVLITDDEREARGTGLFVVKIVAGNRPAAFGDYGIHDFCDTCASRLIKIVRSRGWEQGETLA